MKYLLILMTTLFMKSAHAQGEYLERGNSAFGIGVSAALHPKVTSLATAAAASISGTVDIGVAYTLMTTLESSWGLNSHSSAISPFASVHLLKQSETKTLSFSLNGQYHIHKYSAGEFSTTMGSWAAGGSLYRAFKISENSFLQPSINLSFISPEESMYGLNPPLVTAAEISLALVSRWKNKMGILKPSVSFSRNETTYSIGFEHVNIFLSR